MLLQAEILDFDTCRCYNPPGLDSIVNTFVKEREMRNPVRASVLLAVLFMVITAPFAAVRAQEEIEVTRAAEDLYFLTGVVGNVAFLVTDEGVLVVDSGTKPAHGDAILAEIAKLTDKPVRYLIFTHYHMDHVLGAQRFPEEVTVISHENLPKNQKEFNGARLKEMVGVTYPGRVEEAEAKLESLDGAGEEELAAAAEALEKARKGLSEVREIELVYPDKTYSDAMSIMLGGHEIRLIYPGASHTSGNTLVHFVDLKAVHMGDMLFYKRHPFIDWKAGSNTENWIASLERVREWDVDVVIPGHGVLTDKSGLDWKIGYLTELRAEVGRAVKDGKTLEETKESVKMEKYADLPWTYMLDAGVEAVYNELTGVER
jgi:glyoxylase-like metal-dependent hydrolase (beta-lactamase superfamily II)